FCEGLSSLVESRVIIADLFHQWLPTLLKYLLGTGGSKALCLGKFDFPFDPYPLFSVQGKQGPLKIYFLVLYLGQGPDGRTAAAFQCPEEFAFQSGTEACILIVEGGQGLCNGVLPTPDHHYGPLGRGGQHPVQCKGVLGQQFDPFQSCLGKDGTLPIVLDQFY